MNRQELAQWHREQAEILDSGKPLEGRRINTYAEREDGWFEACGDFAGWEYRLALERKPIPDYDLTESEVKEWIEKGYKYIAQDADGNSYVYGPVKLYNTYFNNPQYHIGRNRYTGPDWRESLRTLKDHV